MCYAIRWFKCKLKNHLKNKNVTRHRLGNFLLGYSGPGGQDFFYWFLTGDKAVDIGFSLQPFPRIVTFDNIKTIV